VIPPSADEAFDELRVVSIRTPLESPHRIPDCPITNLGRSPAAAQDILHISGCVFSTCIISPQTAGGGPAFCWVHKNAEPGPRWGVKTIPVCTQVSAGLPMQASPLLSRRRHVRRVARWRAEPRAHASDRNPDHRQRRPRMRFHTRILGAVLPRPLSRFRSRLPSEDCAPRKRQWDE
jgi:hypothetical protein